MFVGFYVFKRLVVLVEMKCLYYYNGYRIIVILFIVYRILGIYVYDIIYNSIYLWRLII